MEGIETNDLFTRRAAICAITIDDERAVLMETARQLEEEFTAREFARQLADEKVEKEETMVMLRLIHNHLPRMERHGICSYSLDEEDVEIEMWDFEHEVWDIHDRLHDE